MITGERGNDVDRHNTKSGHNHKNNTIHRLGTESLAVKLAESGVKHKPVPFDAHLISICSERPCKF